MNILFLLLAGHALCDYPLQGDFLAKAKNERAPIPGVPWWQAMAAHSMIHGGAVCLITGSAWLGWWECCAHFAIDRMKCGGVIGFNTDQALHVACKVLWAVVLLNGIV